MPACSRRSPGPTGSSPRSTTGSGPSPQGPPALDPRRPRSSRSRSHRRGAPLERRVAARQSRGRDRRAGPLQRPSAVRALRGHARGSCARRRARSATISRGARPGSTSSAGARACSIRRLVRGQLLHRDDRRSFGDAQSLGFVAETERQVEAHLERSPRPIARADRKSNAILTRMAEDEAHHGTMASLAGGAPIAVRRFVVAWASAAKCCVELPCSCDPRHSSEHVNDLRVDGELIKYSITSNRSSTRMEEALRPLSDVPAINRFLSYCRVRTIPGKDRDDSRGRSPRRSLLHRRRLRRSDDRGRRRQRDGARLSQQGSVLRRDGPVLRTAHSQRVGENALRERDRGDDVSAIPPNRLRKPRS